MDMGRSLPIFAFLLSLFAFAACTEEHDCTTDCYDNREECLDDCDDQKCEEKCKELHRSCMMGCGVFD